MVRQGLLLMCFLSSIYAKASTPKLWLAWESAPVGVAYYEPDVLLSSDKSRLVLWYTQGIPYKYYSTSVDIWSVQVTDGSVSASTFIAEDVANLWQPRFNGKGEAFLSQDGDTIGFSDNGKVWLYTESQNSLDVLNLRGFIGLLSNLNLFVVDSGFDSTFDVSLFDIKGAKTGGYRDQKSHVSYMGISPNEKFLALIEGCKVKILDFQSGFQVAEFSLKVDACNTVLRGHFSSDSSKFVFNGYNFGSDGYNHGLTKMSLAIGDIASNTQQIIYYEKTEAGQDDNIQLSPDNQKLLIDFGPSGSVSSNDLKCSYGIYDLAVGAVTQTHTYMSSYCGSKLIWRDNDTYICQPSGLVSSSDTLKIHYYSSGFELDTGMGLLFSNIIGFDRGGAALFLVNGGSKHKVQKYAID